MKTAIVIANNLLKIDSPAAPIERELLEELSMRGVKIIAFCSSQGALTAPSSNYETIIIKESKLWRYFFAVIKLFFPDIVNLPDYHLWTCGKRMEKAIRNRIKTESINYIHSFSFECSCHLVAYNIHNGFNIPWVATFFDSWTDEPSRIFVTKFFRRKDQNYERMVAECSTAIVHNNPGIADLWNKRYGIVISNKTRIIPLNVDFGNLRKSPLQTTNKELLTISHIGTFYKHRDASVFINAISLFVSRYPELRDRLRINFIGTVLKSDLQIIQNNNLTDIFFILGKLPSEECNKYYRETDIFLATAGLPFERITFPSKIIKYFYYERPILGITPQDTVLCSELQQAGHSFYLPENLDGIVAYIYRAITDYKSLCTFDKDYWGRFSTETVGNQYLSIIDNLQL